MFSKKLIRLTILIIGAVILTACSQVTTGVDTTSCVFNVKTGELVEGPITSGREIRLSQDETIVRIPRSVRFWNQNTNPALKDIAASDFSSSRDEDGRTTMVESEIKFIIHPANACDFYVTNLARFDGNFSGALQFNTEGDPNTGWMQVLARNVDTSMQDAYEVVLRDQDGLLGALDLPTNANPDGTIPEGEEPLPTLKALLESPDSELGDLIVGFTANKLGGNYICGPTTDITDPNDCDPVTVAVDSITLSADFDNVINGWEASQVQIAENQLAEANAEIAEEAFELEETRIQAENERQQRLSVLAEEALANELNSNQLTTNLQNERQAEATLALCETARNAFGELTIQECIELLTVDSGQVPDTQILGSGQ